MGANELGYKFNLMMEESVSARGDELLGSRMHKSSPFSERTLPASVLA